MSNFSMPMSTTTSPPPPRTSLRIRRFPYVIHYRIEGEMIVVFAIMFGGRDPSAWQERI